MMAQPQGGVGYGSSALHAKRTALAALGVLGTDQNRLINVCREI